MVHGNKSVLFGVRGSHSETPRLGNRENMSHETVHEAFSDWEWWDVLEVIVEGGGGVRNC